MKQYSLAHSIETEKGYDPPTLIALGYVFLEISHDCSQKLRCNELKCVVPVFDV
jgi:hypothetical protein